MRGCFTGLPKLGPLGLGLHASKNGRGRIFQLRSETLGSYVEWVNAVFFTKNLASQMAVANNLSERSRSYYRVATVNGSRLVFGC